MYREHPGACCLLGCGEERPRHPGAARCSAGLGQGASFLNGEAHHERILKHKNIEIENMR